MESIDPTPVAAAAPLAVAAGAWFLSARARRQQDEKRRKKDAEERARQERDRLERLKNARIPEGATYVCTAGTSSLLRQTLVGAYFLIGIGTFGINQLVRLLNLLFESGLDRLAGTIFVVENDVDILNRFRERVPSVYHDRIVTGSAPSFGGGGANRPVAWIRKRIAKWGRPLDTAAEEAIDLYLRRNFSRSPGLILAFLSQGAQFAMGVLPLSVVTTRFAETLAIGLTAWPKHGRLRKRFEELKRDYETIGGIFGWVATDNLGEDPVTSDYAMVATPMALSGGVLRSDQTTSPNNAVVLALTEEPGAILVYQVWQSSVPAWPFQPDPSKPLRLYALREAVINLAIDGIHALEEDKGIFSADLPTPQDGTSIIDIILVGVEDVTAIEDGVTHGRKLEARMDAKLGETNHRVNGTSGSRFGRQDYDTVFSPLAVVVEDPQKPVCPVICIRLMCVKDGDKDTTVEQIVKAPNLRRFPTHEPTKPSANGPRSNHKTKKPAPQPKPDKQQQTTKAAQKR